ncbi:adenylate kinase [Microbacterium lacus]|uniref:adenylate kinase n=1 Tax=Microbacterium lacus TaxID=415217 RepID=UPI00384FA429
MSKVILMGPPGVGKGTQARTLSMSLSIPAISTGDMFRRQIAKRTPLGLKLQSIIESGEYVPDEITTAVLTERLKAPDASNGFILDGYPRTLAQVHDLDEILAKKSQVIDHVLLLQADRATLLARLSSRALIGNRSDDTPDVIERRLDIYDRETAHIVQAYSERGLVTEVDGEGTPDRVAEQLKKAIGHG